MSESVEIVCNNCGYNFHLNAVDIDQSIIKVDDVTLELKYFVCSHCNKMFLITISDEKLQRLQMQFIKQNEFYKKIIYGKNEESVLSQECVKLLAKRDILIKYENELKSKYQDHFVKQSGRIIYLP